MKILIIQQKFLGDVLVSTILAENLKKFYQDVEIHYVVYRFTMPVLENNPYIDKIVPFEDKYRNSKRSLMKFLLERKKEKYDIIIDSYSKLESFLISLFTKSPLKICKKGILQKLIYNKTVDLSNPPKINGADAINKKLYHLEPIFGKEKFDYQTYPKLYLTDSEKEHGSDLLKAAGLSNIENKNIYILGILGSSIEKTWSVNKMIYLMKHILNTDPKAHLICNYSPSQEKNLGRFNNEFKNNNRVFIPLIGNSLRELFSIVSKATMVIANEGGLIHFAKGIGVPTFSIYAPYHQRSEWDKMKELGIHEAVHIRDFYPELFKGKLSKKLRKNPYELYDKLTTDLVIPKVDEFIHKHIK